MIRIIRTSSPVQTILTYKRVCDEQNLFVSKDSDCSVDFFCFSHHLSVCYRKSIFDIKIKRAFYTLGEEAPGRLLKITKSLVDIKILWGYKQIEIYLFHSFENLTYTSYTFYNMHFKKILQNFKSNKHTSYNKFHIKISVSF